jgi:hypothetical protein
MANFRHLATKKMEKIVLMYLKFDKTRKETHFLRKIAKLSKPQN